MLKMTFVASFLWSAGWLAIAEAQYVLELKNGRQITVQSYREEGSMIKFAGLGGEIAISRSQVQAIRRADEAARGGASSLDLDRLPQTIAPTQPAGAPKSAGVKPASATTGTDEELRKRRADEEKAYQQKIKDLTEQLAGLRDRYSMSTRGSKGNEPSLFTTEEAFKGHHEDLLSRLRDAQFKAQGLPGGSSATTPPYSLDPPPAYSARQRELSDLRSRMNQLEDERTRLIEEMKAKNFDTGSLFLD
jgi:hypothetical protein